jgi:hypothetical protein
MYGAGLGFAHQNWLIGWTQPIGVANDFANVVYEGLKVSGVRNTRKSETTQFEWLKPRASRRGSRFGDRPSAPL